jgi:hypothetical protein
MDGRNTIAWVSDWKARGYPSSAPGNTDMQYRGREGAWQIGEADVYLNAQDFDFSFGTGSELEAQAVITHELGHALGLLHPCEPKGVDGAPDCDSVSGEVTQTTMYPFYTAGQSTLAPDDEAGLCFLYPPLDGCSPACPRGEECVDGECRATCVSGVCGVGEICGFWGCMAAGGCTRRSCLGEACQSDEACGPLSHCVDGVCTGGTAAWGDACRVSGTAPRAPAWAAFANRIANATPSARLTAPAPLQTKAPRGDARPRAGMKPGCVAAKAKIVRAAFASSPPIPRFARTSVRTRVSAPPPGLVARWTTRECACRRPTMLAAAAQ